MYNKNFYNHFDDYLYMYKKLHDTSSKPLKNYV